MHNTKQSKNNSRNYPQYSNITQQLTQPNHILESFTIKSEKKIGKISDLTGLEADLIRRRPKEVDLILRKLEEVDGFGVNGFHGR